MAITFSEELKKAILEQGDPISDLTTVKISLTPADNVATYATVDATGKVIERGECVRLTDRTFKAVPQPEFQEKQSGDNAKWQAPQMPTELIVPSSSPEFNEKQSDVQWAPIFGSPAFQEAQERMEKAALSQCTIEHVIANNAYMQKVMEAQRKMTQEAQRQQSQEAARWQALEALYGETGIGAQAAPVSEPLYWDTLPDGKALTPRQRIQRWADKRGYLMRQMPMADVIMIDAPKFTMRLTYADYMNHALCCDQIELYLDHVEDVSRAKEVRE